LNADQNNRGLQDIGFAGLFWMPMRLLYNLEGGITYNGPAEDPALWIIMSKFLEQGRSIFWTIFKF